MFIACIYKIGYFTVSFTEKAGLLLVIPNLFLVS